MWGRYKTRGREVGGKLCAEGISRFANKDFEGFELLLTRVVAVEYVLLCPTEGVMVMLEFRLGYMAIAPRRVAVSETPVSHDSRRSWMK